MDESGGTHAMDSFWQQTTTYCVLLLAVVFEVYHIEWGRAHAGRRISDKAIKKDRENNVCVWNFAARLG